MFSNRLSTAHKYVSFLIACMLLWNFLCKDIFFLYRPQRSCGKVMFLHLSVILFTGGSSRHRLGRHPRQTTPHPHPLGRHPAPTSGRPPWPDTPHPRPDPAPGEGHCNALYAFYWNTFLLGIILLVTSKHLNVFPWWVAR